MAEHGLCDGCGAELKLATGIGTYCPDEGCRHDRDEMIAGIRAQVAEQKSPWQPIETAPKENSAQLLLCEFSNGEDYPFNCYIGWWWGPQNGYVAFETAPDECEPPNEVGGNTFSDGYFFFRKLNPTHWMPLPPPPNLATPTHAR